MSRFSRDLLQRFMGSTGSEKSEQVVIKEGEDEGEIELNLGLSLGGRFGLDKYTTKLVRSSSIASCLPTVRDDESLAPPPMSYPPLVRTSSLPVETDEEWRKRKELQSLRRMEAKRRRSEKQRSSRADKEDDKREIEVNLKGRLDKEQYLASVKRFGFGGGGIDLGMTKEKVNYLGNAVQGLKKHGSQGSLESLGGSSSSISDLESKPAQGLIEVSPASIQSLQEGRRQDAGSSATKIKDVGSKTAGGEMENPSKRLDTAKSRVQEARPKSLEDMPCVTTKGDGPNGRRVDGILYKYGKGEEVRIMCICHGDFHSPAEFVKHAGGSDVSHPLKHIVINSNPSPFL